MKCAKRNPYKSAQRWLLMAALCMVLAAILAAPFMMGATWLTQGLVARVLWTFCGILLAAYLSGVLAKVSAETADEPPVVSDGLTMPEFAQCAPHHGPADLFPPDGAE